MSMAASGELEPNSLIVTFVNPQKRTIDWPDLVQRHHHVAASKVEGYLSWILTNDVLVANVPLLL